ncbi:sarcosine oxidase subunit gamma [Antarcticirhabdus aurantiaca]|uniref:Sarcosine oxidase subunit gamma n=1 Tax=Antarcticirhabdus aurantiaca TaxID=2606717 RepID=A0ACD4NTC5_9HYPH|nr:sarcosine oxidase subunit gamma [Antarcticirhabdus aurantiaca]WAJ30280.1 sarcosine oxidase subunit gamma [Jeongeuplla avenae]
MADSASLRRVSPLDGRYASGAGVIIAPLPKRRRFSLRARENDATNLSDVLGFALPRRPKTSAESGTAAALWLGPDEWLVFAEGDVADRLAGLSGPAFATEITHRNVAIRLEGPAAEAVLGEGCPQDLRLSRFPVGACSRTVFGKVEVVIWRRSETVFEVEVWRSFSDYLWTYLAEAARAPAL